MLPTAYNSVDSSELVDGTIDTGSYCKHAVTTAKIAGTAVTDAKLVCNQVQHLRLQLIVQQLR